MMIEIAGCQFNAQTRPALIAGDPWSIRWIELRHTAIPQWRRLTALLPDGRVLIAALNVFASEEAAKKTGESLQRPWASASRGGHLYVEMDVCRHAKGIDDLARDRLDMIAAVVRGTAEVDCDLSRPNGIAAGAEPAAAST
jgi:hypothetical protein